MNITHKKQIENYLEGLSHVKIEQIVTQYFKNADKEFVNNIYGDTYTQQDVIGLCTRIIANFNREIRTNTWQSLPLNISYGSLGEIHLMSILDDFYQWLLNSKLDGSFLTAIEKLVYYQRNNNFWYSNDSLIKIESILEVEKEINSKRGLIDLLINELQDLKSEGKELSEKFNQFLTDGGEERKKLETSNKNSEEEHKKIIGFVNEISTSKGRIEEIVKSIEEKSDTSKRRVEDETTRFEEFRKANQEIQKNLRDKIDEVILTQSLWDEKYNSIKEVEEFMKEKEKEIKQLTGFAAGVSLFYTFKERKTELEKPVKFWQWAVMIMTGLVLLVIFIVFYFNPATTVNGTSWGIFGLNTLKSIPTVILLYFAIRQYNKERAFQEEYAFKSSVALTVNAFADILKDNGRSNKDELIINSVSKVYETPNSMNEKNNLFRFRTKSINETLKSLNETIKEIKKN